MKIVIRYYKHHRTRLREWAVNKLVQILEKLDPVTLYGVTIDKGDIKVTHIKGHIINDNEWHTYSYHLKFAAKFYPSKPKKKLLAVDSMMVSRRT